TRSKRDWSSDVCSSDLLLDILQSIPVLSFLPGLVLALVAVFPTTNAGLELAAVLMIFTGQAWNMTFSFYHSLRSIPQPLQEAARSEERRVGKECGCRWS